MKHSAFIPLLFLCSVSLVWSRNFGEFGSFCYCGSSGEKVCGRDGQTYTDQCTADCEGVTVECTGPCPCTAATLTVCVCHGVSDPVCGTNGKTYENDKCATCEGVDIACRGACPCGNAACSCVNTGDPVCGTDGKTYGNECLAGCEGVSAACKGSCPCQASCICTKEYKPVCSTTGKTYGNRCMAECEQAQIACEKRCPCDTVPPSDCVCTEQYQPVCGSDGVTYANDCKANCMGVQIQCNRACPCSQSCNGAVVNCITDPCTGATCAAHPNAECVSNYCGGCNKDFYLNGKIVDCSDSVGCMCTEQYDPVCGVNDQTYGNQCEANCAGVQTKCQGECPCQPQCDGVIHTCLRNPCDGATCAAHPGAVCQPNYCNGCTPEFYKDGVLVDCSSACGQVGDVCDLGLSLQSQSHLNARQCCSDLHCCTCHQSDSDSASMATTEKGTCQATCLPCRR